MAKGFTLGDMVSAIQSAVIEAQEVAEEQHMRQLAEYFNDEGMPVTIPLMFPNPAPDAGTKKENGEAVPLFVAVEVPKITLVPQNSLTINELEINMEVPIGNLSIEDDEDPGADDKRACEEDSEVPLNKVWRRLERRQSKRATISGKKKNLQVSGGSFFNRESKRMATIRIKFTGGDPPEVVARIEQALVKHVDT